MGGKTDDSVLLEAAREREDIVKRYDRGRDPEAPIDPWEDPAFELYHTTDRYGFIHDSRLSTERNDTDIVTKESERTSKWQKMYKSWSKYYGGEKLKTRVYKGIPDRWRGEIWKKLLKLEDTKKDKAGTYEKMKERARTTSPDIRQIDLDVNRTYRNHSMFRERYGIKQTHLFHVLAAYSMYNTEVGYCQGMSQIAALLLMYMDEEDAFWGLSQLLTNKWHAMHGLFIPGFPKLLRFQDHFEHVVKKTMPKIFKFMNANMIPPSLYALKWFMQCFLDRTPFSLTLRLWDIFMLEGDRMLIPMAYTIFRVHKKQLLKMPMEKFVHFLQQDLEKDFGMDDDTVITELEASMQELRRLRLDVPPAPKNQAEVPQKPFGSITYPTTEELVKRQKSQMRINDEHRPEAETKARESRIVQQTSIGSNFSHYDNSPETLPTYDNSPEMLPVNADSSPKLMVYNNTTLPEQSMDEPGYQPQNMDEQHSTPLQQSSTAHCLVSPEPHSKLSNFPSVISAGLILPGHKTNSSSSDQDANSTGHDSFFEEHFEKTLNSCGNSYRSGSVSPDTEVDVSGSRMYRRSSGIRGRGRMTPDSSPRSPLSVRSFVTKSGQSPTELPSSQPYSASSKLTPLMVNQPDGSVMLRINEDINPEDPSLLNGPAIYSSAHQIKPINENERLAINANNLGYKLPQAQPPHSTMHPTEQVGLPRQRIVPPARSVSLSPRPFPLDLSATQNHQFVAVRTQASHYAVPQRSSAIVPNTVYYNPAPNLQRLQSQTTQSYGSTNASGPVNGFPAALPPQNTRMPTTFSTFGGRARYDEQPSSASQRRQSLEELFHYGDSHLRSPAAVSTLPPRFVISTQRQAGTARQGKKFYVVSDSTSRYGSQRTAYNFSEDDSKHEPVYL